LTALSLTYIIQPMSQIPSADSTSRRMPASVGRLRVSSAAEAMADALRSGILSGEIARGSMLPTERELASESGLSRGSVREALKTLAIEGLVSAKVGRHGGYLVQEPPREAVIKSLDVFIRGRGIQQNSLLEVRAIIEPECAALAAGRRDAETLEKLRDLTGRMSSLTEDIPAFLDHNIDWHVAIAEASGNLVLSSVMAAISTNIRTATSIVDYASAEMMRAAQHLHEGVVTAIADGDAEAAHRRMRRHIHATTEVVSLPTAEEPPEGHTDGR
jgi:DNA-binding FadR family transcriptional regulator